MQSQNVDQLTPPPGHRPWPTTMGADCADHRGHHCTAVQQRRLTDRKLRREPVHGRRAKRIQNIKSQQGLPAGKPQPEAQMEARRREAEREGKTEGKKASSRKQGSPPRRAQVGLFGPGGGYSPPTAAAVRWGGVTLPRRSSSRGWGLGGGVPPHRFWI